MMTTITESYTTENNIDCNNLYELVIISQEDFLKYCCVNFFADAIRTYGEFVLAFSEAFLCRVMAFSALTLLVGRQEGHPACKKTEWCDAGVVICLETGADLHLAQLMPLPLTVSCFGKIQIGFTFLVPAHLGSPGKRAVKRTCACVACVWRVAMVGDLGADDARRLRLRAVRVPAERRLHQRHLHGLQLRTVVSHSSPTVYKLVTEISGKFNQ